MQFKCVHMCVPNATLTLPARPSRTAATTVAQAPVPQASVAPKINSACVQLFNQRTMEGHDEVHECIQYPNRSQ